MRHILCTLFLILGGMLAQASLLSYTGCSPESGKEIVSFDDIKVYFDLESVVEGEVNPDDWGIAYYGFYNKKPARNEGVILYKGNATDGEIISQQNDTMYGIDDRFVAGRNYMTLSFPGIEVIPGQEYTIVFTYEVFAADSSNNQLGKVQFKNSPIEISYIGGASVAKTLSLEKNSLSESSSISSISEVTLNFNHEITIDGEFKASVLEGEETVIESNDYNISGSQLTIKFDDTVVYNDHTYVLYIPENLINIAGEANQKNAPINISFAGASYHLFGQKSVLPRPNMPTLLEEIQVNFDFPEGYGFVYVDNETTYPMNVYKGEPIEANLLGSVNYDAITSDSRGLIYHPDLDFEVDNTYTFVLDEDVVKAYEIGAARPTYLKDYKCRRIELSFKTPEASTISKVTFTPQTEPLEMATLEDRFTIPVDAYTFGGVEYDLKGANGKYISLYEISNNGVERKIGDYDFGYLKTTDGRRRLVLLGGNTDAPVGFALDDDKEYRFDIPADYLTVNQKVLKDHSGNEPFSYFIKGTSATSFYVSYSLAEVGTLRTPVSVGKTVTVDITGTEDWKVSAVLFNGEAVETEGDTYTTPAIESDATIEVEYEYAREIDYNFTTGVDMTEICPYGVVSEGENLIISGVQPGDAIAIYTTGGLKVADLPTVPQNMDRVAVSLPTGQAYIILINGKSLKFLHQ